MNTEELCTRARPDRACLALASAFLLLVIASTALAQPGNDQCPGYSITSLPYSYSGSTATANNDYNDCVGHNTRDVVFTLNLWYSYDLIVSLCGSSFDTGLEIRTGGNCPGTTQVGCNNDYIGCGMRSRLTFRNMPSQTYYIIVHGNNGQSGPYQLDVSGTRAVPNDDCSGVITISSLPYSHSGSTAYARNDWSDCVGSNTADVVYALAPLTCPTHVTVSLCGSSYNTGLEVRWGGTCPGNNSLACNDDHCGLQSQITFDAVPTLTYYFIVHGYWGQSGGYVLNVTGTTIGPANDQCPGNPITALPFSASGTTLCAANDYSNCVGVHSPEVVYTMTLPGECYIVTVSLCGSGYNTGLGVRTGGLCPGDSLVACNDDYTGCGAQSQVTFPATRDVPYYIAIHGAGVAAGDYTLQVTGHPIHPDNDICPGTTITSLPFTDTGSTMCAGNDYSGLHCGGYLTPDVVYSLHNVDNCLSLQVSLCGSSYNTGLAVWTDGPCPGQTWVACNDDYCGYQSQVSFVAWPKDYYILVHGAGGQLGDYVMTVTFAPPPNDSLNYVSDTLNNAIELSFGPDDSGMVYGTTYLATNDNAPFCGVADDAPGVWYRIHGLWACDSIVVSTDNDYAGHIGFRDVSVYTYGCDSLMCIGGDGSFPGATVGWCADSGIEYFVLVHGVVDYPLVTFELDYRRYHEYYTACDEAQDNDTCPGTPITSLPYADLGNLHRANYEGYAHCGYSTMTSESSDVVYTLTLPESYSVVAQVCNVFRGSFFHDYGPVLDVRTGGSCPGTSLVVCADSCPAFNAAAGVPYYFIVYDHLSQWELWGEFALNVKGSPMGPANDQCPGTPITTLPFTDSGSTLYAANDYANCVGVHSPEVVYRMTLPECYTITASLCGSGYNTGLGVRTGGSCPGDSLVACNDDFCDSLSLVTFLALMDTTYYLIVHGCGMDAGLYTLQVDYQIGPRPEPDFLVIQPIGPDVVLHWGCTPPACSYKIYRAQTSDVPTIPENLIGTSAETSYLDAGVLSTEAPKYFYVVTADYSGTLLTSPVDRNPDGRGASER